MNLILRPLIYPVLRFLASFPWGDFLRVVGAVRHATKTWQKTDTMTDGEREAVNKTRADYVRGQFPNLAGSRMNLILELAVAYSSRTK